MNYLKHKCSNIVIKVASRCNINCTYCYMYNLGDKTYLMQPKIMKDNVIDALLSRVIRHCKQNELEYFIISFHGGEPLLAGKKWFEKFISKANHLFETQTKTRPIFALQTNGILIDEDWCKLFEDLNMHVAISIDGDRETHDKYRIDHKGKGTYNQVIKGLKNIQKYYNKSNAGYILSVINIHSDPIKVYEHFKDIKINSTDWLFPDNNFDNLPEKPLNSSDTPYADWLITIFDKWFNDKDCDRVKIRLFSDLIKQTLGHYNSTDAYGMEQNELLVIETNGGIEAVDVLKNCGDGFTKTNINVLNHELEDAFEDELIELFENSHQMLCGNCIICPIKNICGGGYLPHRYSSKNGFNNPSVYCKDLMKLITHIQNKVMDVLPKNLVEEENLEKILYQEVLTYVEENGLVDSPYTEKLEYFSKQTKTNHSYA